MPNTNKYKSVGLDIATYDKLCDMSERECRGLGKQLSYLINKAYDAQYNNTRRLVNSGISAVIEN
jgi:macrodomain Ter protein organizer (MatP/YcbG family)